MEVKTPVSHFNPIVHRGGPKEKITRCPLVYHKKFSLKNGVSHTMLHMKYTKDMNLIMHPVSLAPWWFNVGTPLIVHKS
jgi:hypothetical protein